MQERKARSALAQGMGMQQGPHLDSTMYIKAQISLDMYKGAPKQYYVH